MKEVALVTSSGSDSLASVVDVLTGTQIAILKNCATLPGSTALIAGDFVVSAQLKGTALHFWAWGTEQPRLKCHAPEKLGPVCVSGDGSLCAGGGVSGRVYLWEVSSGTLLRAWDAHYKAVTSLAFSADDCFLYTGGEDAMLSAWNVLVLVDPEGTDTLQGGASAGGGGSSVGPAAWTASEHSLPVTCIHAAIAGGRVYTCSLDRSVKAWDACSGRLLLSVACPAYLKAVATDPAENFLFAAGGGGTIFQVDLSATAIAATASDAALAVSFGGLAEDSEGGDDHDSSWGLSLPDDLAGSTIGGGRRGGLQGLRGHEKTVTCLCVTADSSILVSASEDGTMRSWHIASRQCVQSTEVTGAFGSKGGLSQVLLMPLPEALVVVRSGPTRRRLAAPLEPFDKFMRATEKTKSSFTGSFDFSAGCTPVILKGAHCPRGRLGGVISGTTASSYPGIRLALEAIEGKAAAAAEGLGNGLSGVKRREDIGDKTGQDEERGEKMARLEAEVERLQSENLRWQQVNNALYRRLGTTEGR